MYKLPKAFDGAFFIGRILEYVTFSANNVLFCFDEQVSVTVESSLLHAPQDSDHQSEKQAIPIAESTVMQLVGHAVTQVLTDENGTLTIDFDDRQRLCFFDDFPNYKSYLIQNQDCEIIV